LRLTKYSKGFIMADAKLAAWAKDALKAAAAFESAVSTYNLLAKRSQFGFVGGIWQKSVESARTALFAIADKLSGVLVSKNKTQILSRLKVILNKISSISLTSRGPIKSYYVDLSDWYNKDIKPLI
jgi:hypothetical protein